MTKKSLLRILLLLLGTAFFVSCGGDKDEPTSPSVNRPITAITIHSKPTVLNYALDERINLSGLSVYGIYNDGTKVEMPIKETDVSGFDSSKATDNQQLTITISGNTAKFTVKIMPVRVSDGAITEADLSNSTELELPNSVRSIPARMFKNTLLTSIKLNEGLVSIGDEAFACSQLTSIILPGSVVSVGKKAFEGWNKLV